MSAWQQLHAAWQARAPRERKALSLMAAVLAAALLAQSAWEAWQGGTRLRQQWPARAQELARLKLAQAELLRPAQPAAATLSGEALEATLRPEVAALVEGLGLRRSGPRRFVIEGESDFNALNDWLAQTQTRHRLRVTVADLERVAERPGRARVTLELSGE